MVKKFPECIYMGRFISLSREELPAYLPAKQGGFCIKYKATEVNIANNQIENAVLCLLEDMPANLLDIYIFDFANRPNFPYLSQLKEYGISHFILNEQIAIDTFNQLESAIQKRYHHLFSNHDTCLDDYNARSLRPEKYAILIINTDYFPTASISEQRLYNFIKDAMNAGVYIIAMHNITKFTANFHISATLKILIDSLPTVVLGEKDFHSFLPVKKLAQYGFKFVTSSINQLEVMENIKNQFIKNNQNDEQDFMNVKIGVYPSGHDAYLALGEASENYSAMLLGVPGSGKSTLMNNIIMQIAKNYDSSQIQLYLMDFAGVEFSQFKNHPNVKKIFLESNASEVGLSLLKSLNPIVEERRKIFQNKNIQNINVYNKQNPNASFPHILVMIDEFHRLFVRGDWHHNRDVNTELEKIIREYRKFGIYLFLCTQTLQDVDLEKSLKDMIGLRISYRVNNESALGYDIFHNNNSKTIISLQKYEVFVQVNNRTSFTAFIDKPYDIDSTLISIRKTRPKNLQIQAEVVQSQSNQSEYHTQESEVTRKINKQEFSTNIVNPNEQNFQETNDLLEEVARKLDILNQIEKNNNIDIPD